jgi:hypothetical protein
MRSNLAIVFGLVLLVCNTQGSVPVENYMFDTYLTSSNTSATPRVGPVIGVTGELGAYKIYVLSGTDASGTLTSNYVLDVSAKTWTLLSNVNFARAGACYSQDDNQDGIWIYGGIILDKNTTVFTKFNFAAGSFTTLPTHNIPNIQTTAVSCVASADGTKFYVMYTPQNSNCTVEVAVYSAASNWSTVPTTGTPPLGLGSVPSPALLFGNEVVVFGSAACNTDYPSEIYRLNLQTLAWSKDPVSGQAGPEVYLAVNYIDSQSNLLVIGGITSSEIPSSEAYVYNLGNHTWYSNFSLPEARYGAGIVSTTNRAFIFGGQDDSFLYLNDVVQLVEQLPCLSLSCEDCTSSDGCGYCGASSLCLAGTDSPYIPASCNSTDNYITDLDSCPQVFPSYGVALLVIGGVVVVGIIIFAIMKVRNEDPKEGYERIR